MCSGVPRHSITSDKVSHHLPAPQNVLFSLTTYNCRYGCWGVTDYFLTLSTFIKPLRPFRDLLTLVFLDLPALTESF